VRNQCFSRIAAGFAYAASLMTCLILGSCKTIPQDINPSGHDIVSAPPKADSTANPLFDSCKGRPCSCACDDPFDPRVKADSGVYAGKCLNTCDQRSVRMLTKEDVIKYGYFAADSIDTARFLYIANLSGYDSAAKTSSFFVGRVVRDGVESAIVQVEYGGGIQAHGELRFTFAHATPLIAVPQRTSAPRIVERWNDIIYTVEALGPPGVPYKGDFGFKRQYRVAYRLQCLAGMVANTLGVQHRPVGQFRVDFTKKQLSRAFEFAVEQATRWEYRDVYHTTENNCIQAVFCVIDHAAPPAWYRRPLLMITNRTLFLPTRAPHHVRYRGLASRAPGGFHLPDLEDELGLQNLVDPKLVADAKKLQQ
jgi:hypothetical protein